MRRTAVLAASENEARRVEGYAPVAVDRFYVAYQDGSPVGYAAVREGKVIASRMVRDVRVPLLRAVAQGTGKEPKDMLEEPVPFVYDVDKDKIYVGQPGQQPMAVEPPHGVGFTPGGIVEGLYEPGGKLTLLSTTNMPFTVRHLVDLWYANYPTLEVKSVTMKNDDGKDLKLATTAISMAWATNPAAWQATRALQKAGGEVYVVGGAVRDALMDKQPKDVDLLVRGLPQEKVASTLQDLWGRVDYTGKDFGVFRYRHLGQEAEIALPRLERSTGSSHKDFDVQADHTLKIEQDLARRDFTANAIAYDLDRRRLIDPYGGASDIRSGTLRAVTDKALSEDPLRVVRGLVVHARHGLAPDDQTREAMRKHAGSLKYLPSERIQVELDKLMASAAPADGLRLAHETGVLGHILPEVEAAMGYDQNNPHHEQDLGTHLLHVLELTAAKTGDLDVRMAALLHDIGKPASQWTDPETGSSHFYEKRVVNASTSDEEILGADHAVVGARMAHDRLRELKYPNDRIARVEALVFHHMWAAFTTKKGARRFLHRVGSHADDLLLIRWADNGGKGAYKSDARLSTVTQEKLIDQVRNDREATDISGLAISGTDLISVGIPQGPRIGRVLKQLTEDVLEDPSLNTREALLVRALEYD